jgi:hypothetical protein
MTPLLKMSPDEMIRQVLSDGYKGEFSHELYLAFYRGYPIENLRPLLTSKVPNVVALGSYLVYELGRIARPLVREIEALLDNPEPQIKSDAMIALLDCAITKDDRQALGKIMLLLGDEDSFVQRGAMAFVQHCSPGQLQLGAAEAMIMRPDSVFAALSEVLKFPIDGNSIKSLIEKSDPIAKRFGVGLAMKARHVVDADFLEIAQTWDDEEARGLIANVQKYSKQAGAVIARLAMDRHTRAVP